MRGGVGRGSGSSSRVARVQPGVRCDLTGRALKLDGASFEPVPPYTPCSSSSSGSEVAYRLRL